MPDLTALDAVVGQIGAEIAKKDGYHTLVIRSTVAPGTTRFAHRAAAGAGSGRKIGDGYPAGLQPEFPRRLVGVGPSTTRRRPSLAAWTKPVSKSCAACTLGAGKLLSQLMWAWRSRSSNLCNVFLRVEDRANEAGAVS